MRASHALAGPQRAAVARHGRRPVALHAAQSDARPAPTTPAPQTLLALKEWNVTCAALSRGEQTVLLRKGGIKEPRFTPRASAFALFETSFHTDAELLKPGVAERYAEEMASDPKSQAQLRISCVARLTGAWVTPDARLLAATDPLHVWGPGFLDQRLKWRPTQPVTLLELRCYRLRQPLLVPSREEYWGCFSWAELEQQGGQLPGVAALLAGQAAGGLEAALDDAAFAQRQELLRERLEGLDGLEALAL